MWWGSILGKYEIKLSLSAMRCSYFYISIICLLVLSTSACTGNPSGNSSYSNTKKVEQSSNSNQELMVTSIPKLQKWQSYLGSNLEDMLKELSANENHVANGRAYEKLKDLTWLHQPDRDKAHFYFQNDKLILIYLNEAVPEVNTLSPYDLFNTLGNPTEKDYLRSRAGKLARHLAYPEQGIAFSFEGDEILFIELFAPMARAEYINDIYQDPGDFGL
jgi:hypothetical protein